MVHFVSVKVFVHFSSENVCGQKRSFYQPKVFSCLLLENLVTFGRQNRKETISLKKKGYNS